MVNIKLFKNRLNQNDLLGVSKVFGVCVCINTSKIMYTGMVYIDARMQGKILV
jgi:hypothetical protein